MFPGYLFVRDAMTKTRYVEMLSVRGIVRVLEDGWMRLTPVPDADIDAIQRIVQSGIAVSPHALLRHGDRVRVVEGPLSGIEGIFVRNSQQKGCLVVTIDLLGRSVVLEVSDGDVERFQ
jgi:transcriptional antiterminator NusG